MVEAFQLSQLADLVYHLVFDDYCDWYLELLKAGEADPEVAGHALEQVLALAHPLMPFVTEECWSRMPGAEGLMAVHPPRRRAGPGRPRGRGARSRRVQEVVTALRAYRSRRGAAAAHALVVEPVPAAVGRPRPRRGGRRARAVPTSRRRPAARAAGRSRRHQGGQAVDPEVERDAPARRSWRRPRASSTRAQRKLADARFVERAPAAPGGRPSATKVARYAAEREALAARIAALG